jgi:hypothetical protein
LGQEKGRALFIPRNAEEMNPTSYHRIGRIAFEEMHSLDIAGLVRRLNRIFWRAD